MNPLHWKGQTPARLDRRAQALGLFFLETYQSGAIPYPFELRNRIAESTIDLEKLNKARRKPTPLNLHVSSTANALKQVNENRAEWAINLFKQAGEASGSFHFSYPRVPTPPRGAGSDNACCLGEINRRARG